MLAPGAGDLLYRHIPCIPLNSGTGSILHAHVGPRVSVAKYVKLWRLSITARSTGEQYYMFNSIRSISAWDVWTHLLYKNTKRHTAHTIVSWPNPKQWVKVHTSDLMMIIRQSIYILSIITRKWVNWKHTTPKYIWQHFISSVSSDKFAQWW